MLLNKNTLLVVLMLTSGVVGQTVQYGFSSTCAVRGSTVTLPCSFTPKPFRQENGKDIPLKIVRVRWCVNHELCQGSTPSVVDSNSSNNNSRYQYLGDMKTNCTLQVRDVQMIDDATFRFRMEADHTVGHFIKRPGGMTVSVVEETKMIITSSSSSSSSSSSTFRRGQNVSLQCTSGFCTVHQLEITWIKDGGVLSETGPTLLLDPLSLEDSGNYNCILKPNSKTLSEPFRLQVEEEIKTCPVLIVHLVLISVITVLFIIVMSLAIKRLAGSAQTHPEVQSTDFVEEL